MGDRNSRSLDTAILVAVGGQYMCTVVTRHGVNWKYCNNEPAAMSVEYCWEFGVIGGPPFLFSLPC